MAARLRVRMAQAPLMAQTVQLQRREAGHGSQRLQQVSHRIQPAQPCRRVAARTSRKAQGRSTWVAPRQRGYKQGSAHKQALCLKKELLLLLGRGEDPRRVTIEISKVQSIWGHGTGEWRSMPQHMSSIVSGLLRRVFDKALRVTLPLLCHSPSEMRAQCACLSLYSIALPSAPSPAMTMAFAL